MFVDKGFVDGHGWEVIEFQEELAGADRRVVIAVEIAEESLGEARRVGVGIVDGGDVTELGQGELTVPIEIGLIKALDATFADGLADRGFGSFTFLIRDFPVAVEVPSVAESFLALEPVFAKDLEFFLGKPATFIDIIKGEVFGEGAISKGTLLGEKSGRKKQNEDDETEHDLVFRKDEAWKVCVTKSFHDG